MADEANNNLVQVYKPEGINNEPTLSNGDLPWAIVMLPTTSSGLAGMGENKHQLKVGSWVFGFFADGDNCQQPIILGTYAGGLGAGTTGAGQGGSALAGGSTSSPDVPAALGGGIAGEDAVYSKLRSLGFSHIATAGIMGNLVTESKLNSGALNPNDKGKSSFGVAQWRGDRQRNLYEYARTHGNRPASDINVQLEFIHFELNHKSGDAGYYTKADLDNAHTAQDAAVAFMGYERPEGYSRKNNGVTTKDYTRRVSEAKRIAEKFTNQTSANFNPDSTGPNRDRQ